MKRTWSRKEYEDNFDRDRSGPRAYRFETSILGVNHAIHDEAEELLYKRNIFIVLSYEYFGLGNEIGGLVWLPIVSNKHAPRMKMHAVRFHVSPGTSGYQDPILSGNSSMQSAIFLARDLEVFCLIMATAGSTCIHDGLAVMLSRYGAGIRTIGPAVGFITSDLKPSQFMSELRNTKHRQIDAATQRQLLAPMARILCSSQRVTFKGIVCDFPQVERLKQIMSPSLSCDPALKWAFFEALSMAKDVADAAVPYDDIKFVMNLFHKISLTLLVCTYTLNDGPAQVAERRRFLSACPEVAEACDILLLEACVNVAFCAMKARDITVLLEASNDINKSIQRRAAEGGSWDVPPELELHFYSIMLWKCLYCDVQSAMPTVRAVAYHLKNYESGPHQTHDSEILSRHPDQGALVTREHLPFEQCSAVQLPLPSLSCHKALMVLQDRFKGWLDMDIIRSLDEGMKKNINSQQKCFRIKVTDFDELEA
jgi:hypothetical protein